ncbi:MAG TPA: PIN domain-containing protein [Longimicrobium sp.]|nr:PIN domain-containing protein [Longimicrobium sp.]
MRRWFLDASYLIALEWKDDQWHSEAMAHWAGLRLGPKSLVTTSFVIDEVVNFFVSRGHHQRAIQAGDLLLSSGGVEVVWADEELVRAGFEYLRRRGDKRYSLTDCISFVVMNRLGIMEALTFDTHFEQAGFVRLPRA